MRQDYSTFLALVRFSIGHYLDRLPEQINWDIIQTLASEHGLFALLLDGIELLPDTKRPPKDVLLNWIGNSLQIYNYRYETYEKTIAELAAWYNSHGFKMMVLKGYGCCIDWPKPEHRPCGDIDLWLFGEQKEADILLAKEKGISIERFASTSHCV